MRYRTAVLGGVAVSLLAACSAGPAARHATDPGPAPDPSRAYLAVAGPANDRLDTYFDRLEDEVGDLNGAGDVHAAAAVRAALHGIARVEHHFDRGLQSLHLPPGPERDARALVVVNERRADLTALVARGPRARLAVDVTGVEAMNAPVESAVLALRRDLGLPPPDTD